MNQKEKARVFDFIMTMGTIDFILQIIYLKIFGKPSRRLEQKVWEFICATK
jgi:hypothetical protein